MINVFLRFLKNESAATAIEYGLIAALMGVAIISALTATGLSTGDIYGFIETNVVAAMRGAGS